MNEQTTNNTPPAANDEPLEALERAAASAQPAAEETTTSEQPEEPTSAEVDHDVELQLSGDGYDLELPDYLPAQMTTPESLERVREVGVLAREAGVPQAEIQRFVDLYVDRALTAPSGIDISDPDAVRAHLKFAWGTEYDSKLKAVHKAVDAYGPKFARWLDQTGAGNDPAMLSVLADIGSGVATISKEGARQELEKILSNKKSPYWRGTDRDHKAVVERVRALGAIAHAGEDDTTDVPKAKAKPSSAAVAQRESLENELARLKTDPAYFDKRMANSKAVRARVSEIYELLYPDDGGRS